MTATATPRALPGSPENPLVLRFHTDSGHGWLEATAGLLRRFGIAHKVSAYSYRGNGYTVFLEEDCDAPLLLNALRASGVVFALDELPPAGHLSHIRRLQHYMPVLDDFPVERQAV